MTRLTMTIEEAFTAGAAARSEGVPLEDNPYPMDVRHHAEWAAGWAATFDLDEENDPLSSRMRRQDDVTPVN